MRAATTVCSKKRKADLLPSPEHQGKPTTKLGESWWAWRGRNKSGQTCREEERTNERGSEAVVIGARAAVCVCKLESCARAQKLT